jgi:xanthine dehydrogenase YagS FAD-binding subunit
MKQFDYIAATSTAEALRALASSPADAQILAGGTTLVDLMKLNVERPSRLVDITGIPELKRADFTGNKELVIGALYRMSDAAEHPILKRDYPALSEALWRAASQQLRNMATLGGNLLQRTRCTYFRSTEFPCNKREPGTGCSAINGLNRNHAILGTSDKCIAAYPGDWAIALTAFDATVDTVSPRGERSIRIGDLHRAPGNTPHVETILAADEVIVRTRIPITPIGKGSTYLKVRDRESYAFALTSAATAVLLDGERVQQARIAVGGVATRPWRCLDAERSLIGKRLTEDTARTAGEIAFEGAKTSEQNKFRVPLGVNTIVQALMTSKKRAQA